MHPNDLKEFRDNIAMPRMMQLFETTHIPEGACYIDNLELEFLDGRSCGVDSHIVASGLIYYDGQAKKYMFDEYDADFNAFFEAHKDCVFLSDGKLRINDDMDEMVLNTKIRNVETCKNIFPWLDISCEIKVEMTSVPYEKLKYLLENQQKTSLDEQIGVAGARVSEPKDSTPVKENER